MREPDRQRHRAIAPLAGGDRRFDCAAIAADDADETVDHHLRRIDMLLVVGRGVSVLPRAEGAIGQRIFPADILR